MVKKSIRANFQKSTGVLTAAANKSQAAKPKPQIYANKTAAQPSAGSLSAR
jgi:hypothetical protein